MACPVVLSFSNRKMTKEQWRYVWRAARIAWREAEPIARRVCSDLMIYGTSVVYLP